jgi:hypothetical protein
VATCPRCGEFLDEHHCCPRVPRRLLRTGGMAAAGALLGLVLPLAMFDRPAMSLVLITSLLGAVLFTAFYQTIRL